MKEEFKFIFYFCGHGYRSVENVPNSYLLLYDSDSKGEMSIPLDSLFVKISRLSSSENYVLIDACHLRVNQIVNPKLEEELRGNRKSRKSLFCLLSSGIEQSFEGDHFGYFTDALLRSLASMNKVEGSPTELLDSIQRKLEKRGLPLPEMYTIGHPVISLVPIEGPSFPQVIYRHELVVQIQDLLIQNRKKIVCLIGEEGIGKSTLCQFLASDLLKIVAIQVPSDSERFSPFLQYILGLADNYLLVLDGIDSLNLNQINVVLEIVSGFRSSVVFSSNHSLRSLVDKKFFNSFIDLPIPPFTFLEGKQLAKMNNRDCSDAECAWISVISCGNPLKIKKIARSSEEAAPIEFSEGMKGALSAVYSCGMYINERLFVSVFEIEEGLLQFLKEIGLIKSSEEGYIPHDLVYEIVQAEKLELNREKALKYWCQQMEELPTDVWAAKHLLFSLRYFGYRGGADRYAKLALEALSREGTKFLSHLVESSEIFLPVLHLTEASLFLAEYLVEAGELDAACELLGKKPATHEIAFQGALCEIQRLWKTGLLEESIGLCSELIDLIGGASALPICSFYRGMGYFLQGNWEEAFSDFTFVYERSFDPQSKGRAQCMLGTIMGLRGIDLNLSEEHLKAGIQVLTELKDFSGVWSGWNNLGEIFWKSGEYQLSAFYLEKALEIANMLGEGPKMETYRNLLHLYLRAKGPFSHQATECILKMESIGWVRGDVFERGQILNTLCTAYLFRKNVKAALYVLKSAVSLTGKSKEYHIYTLSNLSLLARFLGLEEKSSRFLSTAMQLAESGRNYLALDQIKNDAKICFESAEFLHVQ